MTDPPLPPNALAIDPMPQYDLWWRLTERCSAKTGDLKAIHWYIVPGASQLGSPDIQGIYYPLSRRIILAGRFARTGSLVRHEMLHALIVAPGDHPSEYFQRRCGGVVECDDACVRDGGPLAPVDSGGSVVPPAALEVAARADSTSPSLSRDSGWVALTIDVRNPGTSAVRLRLVPIGPGAYAHATFGYRLQYCDGIRSSDPFEAWSTDSTMVLGAGEVRRQVFDFQIWDVCTLVRPYFNDDTLPVIRLDPVS